MGSDPLWASEAWGPRTTTLRLEVKQYKLKMVKTEEWSDEDNAEEESSDLGIVYFRIKHEYFFYIENYTF